METGCTGAGRREHVLGRDFVTPHRARGARCRHSISGCLTLAGFSFVVDWGEAHGMVDRARPRRKGVGRAFRRLAAAVITAIDANRVTFSTLVTTVPPTEAPQEALDPHRVVVWNDEPFVAAFDAVRERLGVESRPAAMRWFVDVAIRMPWLVEPGPAASTAGDQALVAIRVRSP